MPSAKEYKKLDSYHMQKDSPFNDRSDKMSYSSKDMRKKAAKKKLMKKYK